LPIRVDRSATTPGRFNFLVDLLFDDASHLNASADGLEVNEETEQQQTFGLN